MKAKLWIVTTLALVASQFLAGCGATEAPTAAPTAVPPTAAVEAATAVPATAVPATAAPAAGEKVKITVFVGFGTGTEP